jgi:hypothetical protein
LLDRDFQMLARINSALRGLDLGMAGWRGGGDLGRRQPRSTSATASPACPACLNGGRALKVAPVPALLSLLCAIFRSPVRCLITQRCSIPRTWPRLLPVDSPAIAESIPSCQVWGRRREPAERMFSVGPLSGPHWTLLTVSSDADRGQTIPRKAMLDWFASSCSTGSCKLARLGMRLLQLFRFMVVALLYAIRLALAESRSIELL